MARLPNSGMARELLYAFLFALLLSAAAGRRRKSYFLEFTQWCRCAPLLSRSQALARRWLRFTF
jgi:hypothetical protein